MIVEALERYYLQGEQKYRKSIVIGTSEGHLLALMDKIPSSLEFSSLPSTDDAKREVEISFASHNADEVEEWIGRFAAEAKRMGFALESSGRFNNVTVLPILPP